MSWSRIFLRAARVLCFLAIFFLLGLPASPRAETGGAGTSAVRTGAAGSEAGGAGAPSVWAEAGGAGTLAARAGAGGAGALAAQVGADETGALAAQAEAGGAGALAARTGADGAGTPTVRTGAAGSEAGGAGAPSVWAEAGGAGTLVAQAGADGAGTPTVRTEAGGDGTPPLRTGADGAGKPAPESGSRTPPVSMRESGYTGFLLTEGEGLSLGLGSSLSESPYRRYDLEWLPLPLVFYEGEYVYLRGTRAGVKLVNQPHVEFSLFGAYDSTSFDAQKTNIGSLRRLTDRHASAEMGAQIRVLTPLGMLYVDGAGDVLDNSGGFRGTAGYGNSWEFGPFEIAPSLGVYWSSSRYNNYYYGVSEHESHRSGIDAYAAGAGVSPFLGLTLSCDLGEHWGVFWNGEAVLLNDAVRDSPMVSKSRIHNTSFGILYGF